MDRELDASQREHIAEQYRILKTTPFRLIEEPNLAVAESLRLAEIEINQSLGKRVPNAADKQAAQCPAYAAWLAEYREKQNRESRRGQLVRADFFKRSNAGENSQ